MSGGGKKQQPVLSHDPLAELDESPAPAADAAAGNTVPDALALGDGVTIADVAELRERLRTRLDLGGTLKIQAGDLEQLDAAGVQLICAALKDARGQGLAVEWDGVSQRLRDAAASLGLVRELGF